MQPTALAVGQTNEERRSRGAAKDNSPGLQSWVICTKRKQSREGHRAGLRNSLRGHPIFKVAAPGRRDIEESGSQKVIDDALALAAADYGHACFLLRLIQQEFTRPLIHPKQTIAA